MKRRLNARLLLVLVGCTVVLGLGVHFLHRFQVKNSAKTLFTQAERAEKAGDLAKAEDYLARYLAFRPDDTTGLVQYARVLEKLNPSSVETRVKALRVYEKAARVGDPGREVRRRIVDLAIELGDHSAAKPQVESLLRTSPGDGELTFLLGFCEEGGSRFREAAALYEKARELDPSRIVAYSRLASLLRERLRDTEQADAVMDSPKNGLIARNGRSAKAYLARAFYRQRYPAPGADPSADIARALELAPDDAEVLLSAAATAESKGDREKARGYLERGLARHAGNAMFYHRLAELEIRDRHLDKAVDLLRQGIKAVPESESQNKAALKWSLVNALVDAGRSDPPRLKQAEDLLLQMEKDDKTRVRPELLDYLKAEVLQARGRWSEAARALESLHPTLAATGLSEFKSLEKTTLFMLGQCYERLGVTDRSIDVFRRAVAMDVSPDPLWASARMGLASALVAQNRIDDAIEQYRIVLPREPSAGLALARLQIAQNLRRPASEQDRHWAEVEQTLIAVERGSRNLVKPLAVEAEVSLLRAEAAAAQGRIAAARGLLEDALKDHPDRIELWTALANVAGREGSPEASLAVLDDAQKRLGDRVELRLARIEFNARRGGDAAKEALARIEGNAETMPAEDRVRVLRGLATAYAQIGEETRAADLWRRLAELTPDDLDVRTRIVNLALQSGDLAAANVALAQVRRIEGEAGTIWPYTKARILIREALKPKSPADEAKLNEARALLEEVSLRRPSWPLPVLATAEADWLSGQLDRAATNYLKAILELGERDDTVIGRALQLLISRQRLDEAAQVVQKLRDEKAPLSADLRRLVATVSFKSGNPAQALEQAEKAVPSDSEKPGDLIWLGLIRWRAGQNAEPTFRRAIALDETSPGARLALVQYLVGVGRKSDAEAALAEAERVLPRDRAALALAQGNEAVGRRERAGELYRLALQTRPSDDLATLRATADFELRSGHLAESESLMRQMIDVPGDMPDIAWARRMLPVILAARGNRKQSIKALEALGLLNAARPGGGSPDDLRSRAKALALQPNRKYRQDAVEVLEELIRRKASTPDDLALLAQLLAANGDWPKARERFLELLNARKNDPNDLALFIQALLRHEQADEAQVYLALLKKQAPDRPLTLELEARVLSARGRAGEAVKRIKTFALGDDGRLFSAARLLEQIGRNAEAETLYRRYDEVFRPRFPQSILVLSEALGRLGKTQEAFDLLDQAWAVCPPENVSGSTVLALYGARGDIDSFAQRAADRIVKAIGKYPDRLSLQFDLASVRSLQGRFPEAESIYRKVHEQDKSKGFPLNNLAWLKILQGDKGAEALALVKQAADLEGETPDLLDTRALAYLVRGQTDLAIEDLENAVAVSPTADKYFHLARAYQAKGQTGNAEIALNKSKELGLTPQSLNPLERPSYQQLTAKLAKK